MKSELKKLKGTKRQFNIEVSKDLVEETFNNVIEDIRKNAKISGFRQGKAPLDIVQKKHTKDALVEVKNHLIPSAYQKALEDHEINPLSYPEVFDVDIEDSGIFTFKATVDIYPEVNLKRYKGLVVTNQKIKVDDKEAEETFERLRNIHAEFTDIDSPLKKGDFGICDVETFFEDKSIAKKRENMWIEVNKEASLLGMGEDLCGMKKGETKDIKATLPENYSDKQYAGKEAVFKVEIKETKEKKLPELDDELAQKLGKEDLKTVREEIRTQLLERKEINAKVAMKNQIMEQLLNKHSFDLPKSMVDRQLKVLMEKAENELTRKGVDAETIESHKEKLKDQLYKEAENKVKLYFILDKISNCENVDVNDDEVDNWIKALAESYNQPVDAVKKYYTENNLMGGVKEQLREDKTLDLLLSEATITEKE